MSYETKNELKGFSFGEAQVGNVQIMSGVFHLVLDNVMILPENSCNRDIRMMRCNELLLTIENPEIIQVIEEGYKLYDANGNLREEMADKVIEPADYVNVWEYILGGAVYSIEYIENADNENEDNKDNYRLIIDGINERTYSINLNGTGDTESWERFLNL